MTNFFSSLGVFFIWLSISGILVGQSIGAEERRLTLSIREMDGADIFFDDETKQMLCAIEGLGELDCESSVSSYIVIRSATSSHEERKEKNTGQRLESSISIIREMLPQMLSGWLEGRKSEKGTDIGYFVGSPSPFNTEDFSGYSTLVVLPSSFYRDQTGYWDRVKILVGVFRDDEEGRYVLTGSDYGFTDIGLASSPSPNWKYDGNFDEDAGRQRILAALSSLKGWVESSDFFGGQ